MDNFVAGAGGSLRCGHDLGGVGFVAEELIGFGASGEVWRGRDTTTGDVVALKRLRVGSDPGDHAALRREAALLSAFRHPHVVGLRAALATRDGVVLVLDHAGGGSLSGLLARRGALPAGQVAALMSPLARALAAAHAAGLVHGDISSGNVLLDAHGQPLLADLGTARLLGESATMAYATPGFLDPAVAAGGSVTPASNVYALGALAVLSMLGPAAGDDPAAAVRQMSTSEPLVSLVRRMLRPEPSARPTAAQVGDELERIAPATAGWLPAPAHPALLGAVSVPRSPAGLRPAALTHAIGPDAPAGPLAGRHRSAPLVPAPDGHLRWRRRVLLVTAPLALVMAVVIGFVWGGGTQSVQQPARTVAAAKPSWFEIWATLDGRRAQAFAIADATRLSAVYVPGSSGLAADLRAVRHLAADHLHAVGVAHQTRSVRAVTTARDTATLLVVDTMDGYQVRDVDEHLVTAAAPRGERSWRARLVRTERGWLIAGLSVA